MAGYEYGNARLRAMKSRLLSSQQMAELAGSQQLDSLILGLTRSPYQSALDAALVRAVGLEAIDLALRQDLVQTVRKIRGFFDETADRLVGLNLCAYDVHNLKAILRGLASSAAASDIMAALLPIGELSEPVLAELANAADPRVAIDLLASMRQPLAHPLLELRARLPGVTIEEMELTLDQWRFSYIHDQLSDIGGDQDIFKSAIALDADLTNLLTVFRMAYAPAERDVISARLQLDGLRAIFVRGGRISLDLLVHASEQNTLDSAIDLLSHTVYAEPLRSGLGAYQRTRRLSELEKHLRYFRLGWMNSLFSRDSLGIGVMLGYLALKTSEVSNLRWIAHGISVGLKVDDLRAELEFAA